MATARRGETAWADVVAYSTPVAVIAHAHTGAVDSTVASTVDAGGASAGALATIDAGNALAAGAGVSVENPVWTANAGSTEVAGSSTAAGEAVEGHWAEDLAIRPGVPNTAGAAAIAGQPGSTRTVATARSGYVATDAAERTSRTEVSTGAEGARARGVGGPSRRA